MTHNPRYMDKIYITNSKYKPLKTLEFSESDENVEDDYDMNE